MEHNVYYVQGIIGIGVGVIFYSFTRDTLVTMNYIPNSRIATFEGEAHLETIMEHVVRYLNMINIFFRKIMLAS